MSLSFHALIGLAIVGTAAAGLASRDARARSPGGAAVGSLRARRAGPQQAPDGRQLYATTCSACHQLTGLGLPEVYPPLAGSEWVTGDEERLIRVVLHGLTGEIEVAGETVSGAMPAWGESLDDASVAAVLTYIRGTWSNAAPAITPATVARVRRATAGRTSPWTAKELAGRIPPPR
jgi:mono/diheme cytochrome c family protein